MSAQDTAALRFVREFEWANTLNRVRVFEFLRDCPEIPATRTEAIPPHAAAGDELWVEIDDDSSPFTLRRDRRAIGQPEAWQMEDYLPLLAEAPQGGDPDPEEPTGYLKRITVEFHGQEVEGWQIQSGAPFRYPAGWFFYPWRGEFWIQKADGDPEEFYRAEDYLRADRVVRDPELREAIALVDAQEGRLTIELAVETIPETPIERGDVVIVKARHAPLPQVRGRLVPLALEHYERVRTHFERCASTHSPYRGRQVFCTRTESDYLPIINISPIGFGNLDGGAAEFFANRVGWGKRRREWTPDVFVVKRVRPEQAVPIQARSDDAALFELLAQVGGRMPQGGGR